MPEQPELTPEQRKELEEKLKNMSPEEIAALQKQQCIFCQIITNKIPAKKVYEDKICEVILDINPATKGHLLILPKEHYSIMPQIPDKVISYLFVVAKSLSQVLLKSLRASGTSIFIANGQVAGQRAQHFLVHVIPRKEDDSLFNVENKYLDAAMIDKVKTAISDKLNELLGVREKVIDDSEQDEEPEPEEDEEPEEDNEKPEEEQEPEDEDDNEEPEELEDEKPKEENDNKASLDDIANLFK